MDERDATRWTSFLGYATCYAWTFCISSIYEFGGAPTAASFALRVLPGVLACLAVLVVVCGAGLRGARALQCFMRTPVPAFLASLGTLFAVVPELNQTPWVAYAGMVCAGFFFLFVLMQWGLAFAQLDRGHILGLSGLSFFVAAVVAFAVSWMPLDAAALTTSLMPLVGFAFLHALPTEGAQLAETSLEVAAAVPGAGCLTSADGRLRPVDLPWRTFAGLFAIFFAYNGIVATRTVGQSWLGNAEASFLALPCVLALVFVALGRAYGTRYGLLSLVAKGALAAVTLPFMLATYALEVPASLAFADGLAMYTASWVILVLAVKDAAEVVGGWDQSRALVAFGLGWIAQTLGGALTYFVAPLDQVSEMLYSFLMVAFVIVAGVEFFSDLKPADGRGMRDANESIARDGAGMLARAVSAAVGADTMAFGIDGGSCAGDAEASPVDPAAEFCAMHALSAREAEVFRLWVTGHGVRDITQKLCMSESTAKTHVRHIYDKCGVYGKARLLEAFEAWQAENEATCR